MPAQKKQAPKADAKVKPSKSAEENTTKATATPDKKPAGKRGNAGNAGGKNSNPATGAALSSASAASASQQVNQQQQQQTPKNDVRTLVSGTSSWTGKLPMNLWAEYCQKQKWQKPEYGMRKIGANFVSWVFVRRTNPKNGEVTETVLRIPSVHEALLLRPTAVEARHLAATYALFRVASAKNLHMMLPPNVRDTWKEFKAVKEADIQAGASWMYREDPFAAKAEHDAEKEAKKVSREQAAAVAAQRRNEDKEKQIPLAIRDASINNAGWAHAPVTELGSKRRIEVESTIRKYSRWNTHGECIKDTDKKAIVEELSNAGFRRSHVTEATELCKDREECLEWLLIHVPEDDLPTWAFPKEYRAGVSIASTDIGRANALALLSQGGYPSATCALALNQHGGDALAAAAALQKSLESGRTNDECEDVSDDTVTGFWEEEMETLEAIFGPKFQKQGQGCHIDIEIEGLKCTLVANKSKSYPQEPPILALHGSIPAYIKLKVYQNVLAYSRESFLGEPMIYNIVDWMETSARSILQNPGSLLDISAATGGTADAASKHGTAQSRTVMPRRTRLPNKKVDQTILDEYRARQNQQAFKDMLGKRQALPAWNLREQIITTVRQNQVTIISGETGSGKSTQVVQFVLEDMIESNSGSTTNIVCTQPRRIAALGLADRVSAERCTDLGDEVGYLIRGEAKQKPGKTKITFVTTGVLLRRFQGFAESEQSLPDALSDCSHVVLDEVHERDLDTDFLLRLLKTVVRYRADLKVILMSATIDAAVFENYFSQFASVGKAHIPGRTFPITDYYLEDVVRLSGFQQGLAQGPKTSSDHGPKIRLNYDLISAAVTSIHTSLSSSEGGILIFLSGVAEINRAIDALRSIDGLHVLPLHAALTPSEQRLVFRPPPKGRRKIVVATNIAETSITVEDIVATIDSGLVKQTSYDPVTHMVKLGETVISKAAAMQRRGRAGRVRAGECYKLYSKADEARMAHRPDPEILRTPLEQLFLMTRAMGVADVHEFLGGALTPPSVAALDKAERLLRSMGAFDGNRLSALGEHLAQIPADLRLGKLLVCGALFGCLEECLNIASILAAKSPFLGARDVQTESKQARMRFAEGHGDLIGDMRAFEEWLKRRKMGQSSDLRQWVSSNYLSYQALQDILSNKTQFTSSLRDIGFLKARSQEVSSSGVSMTLLRAVVAGAFHPQTARIQIPEKKYASTISGALEQDPEARSIKYFLKDTGRVFIHPSSTLFDAQSYVAKSLYMSYFNSMATAKVFIRDLTPFNAFTLLLFCGDVALDTRGRGLVVDGWLKLQGWARIGVLSSRLRALLDDILARHFDDPASIAESQDSKDVLKCVQGLLQFDGLDE